jgi:hypothetical protein
MKYINAKTNAFGKHCNAVNISLLSQNYFSGFKAQKERQNVYSLHVFQNCLLIYICTFEWRQGTSVNSLRQWYSTSFVRIPTDVISLQLLVCTLKVVGA